MSKDRKRETRYVSMVAVWVPDAVSLVKMMRHDCCCPVTEVEAGKIARLIDGDASPMDHTIRLIRFAAADEPPTFDRWRSYGCAVLDERSPDATPPTDADLINLVKEESGSSTREARRR